MMEGINIVAREFNFNKCESVNWTIVNYISLIKLERNSALKDMIKVIRSQLNTGHNFLVFRDTLEQIQDFADS